MITTTTRAPPESRRFRAIERLDSSTIDAGPVRRAAGAGEGVNSYGFAEPVWLSSDMTEANSNSTPHRRATRPASPPSWRTLPKSMSSTSSRPQEPGVTRDALVQASTFLDQGTTRSHSSPVVGVSPLSYYIYRVVIRYLDCTEIYWSNEDGSTTTYGQILCEQVRGFRGDFKVDLLTNHSSHPTPRLADETIQTILSPAHGADSGMTIKGSNTLHGSRDIVITDDSRDRGSLTPMIHRLGITCHPDPSRLLRPLKLSPTIALTCLDLAYSAIPQVETLVSALPGGMRELGLAGVRCSSGEEFFTLLHLLGKRLALLQTLDLSHSKHMSYHALVPLLHPADSQLPSLRRLGLRGVNTSAPGRSSEIGTSGKEDLDGIPSAAVKVRMMWNDRIMLGRQRYIKVVWE